MVIAEGVRPLLSVFVLFVMLCDLLRLQVCLPTGTGSPPSQCVECSAGSVCPEEAGLRSCWTERVAFLQGSGSLLLSLAVCRLICGRKAGPPARLCEAHSCVCHHRQPASLVKASEFQWIGGCLPSLAGLLSSSCQLGLSHSLSLSQALCPPRAVQQSVGL